MSKTIKNTFLAAMAMAVLCVGTVSARQLRNGPGLYLRRHLQRHPALYFHQYQLLLFLYHADHRILHDASGRGRASREIATGKARMRRITEEEK